MDTDKALRDHLLYLLGGGGAHLDFRAITANMPFEAQGKQPEGLPYTPWGLLEHLRISQWDILEFSRNPDHVSPKWPDAYWPQEDGPSDEAAWEERVTDFLADSEQMKELVADPGTDLYTPLTWGDGQTILREAQLVADHNAYHLGQMVAARRLLGVWPPDA